MAWRTGDDKGGGTLLQGAVGRQLQGNRHQRHAGRNQQLPRLHRQGGLSGKTDTYPAHAVCGREPGVDKGGICAPYPHGRRKTDSICHAGHMRHRHTSFGASIYHGGGGTRGAHNGAEQGKGTSHTYSGTVTKDFT